MSSKSYPLQAIVNILNGQPSAALKRKEGAGFAPASRLSLLAPRPSASLRRRATTKCGQPSAALGRNTGSLRPPLEKRKARASPPPLFYLCWLPAPPLRSAGGQPQSAGSLRQPSEEIRAAYGRPWRKGRRGLRPRLSSVFAGLCLEATKCGQPTAAPGEKEGAGFAPASLLSLLAPRPSASLRRRATTKCGQPSTALGRNAGSLRPPLREKVGAGFAPASLLSLLAPRPSASLRRRATTKCGQPSAALGRNAGSLRQPLKERKARASPPPIVYALAVAKMNNYPKLKNQNE